MLIPESQVNDSPQEGAGCLKILSSVSPSIRIDNAKKRDALMERILKVRKKSGNRERCRKLSL